MSIDVIAADPRRDDFLVAQSQFIMVARGPDGAAATVPVLLPATPEVVLNCYELHYPLKRLNR